MTESEKRRRLLYGNRPKEEADPPPVEDPVIDVPEPPALDGSFPQDLGRLGTQMGTQMGRLGTQDLGRLGTQTTLGRLGTQTEEPAATAQPTPRYKDERTQLNLKISQEKLERFRAWCHENNIGQREAVELALDQLMGRLGTQTTQTTLSTQTYDFHRRGSSLDDVDLYTVNIVIAALFVEIVGREMSPNDQQVFSGLRHFGGNVIVCAMLLGGVRKKGKPIGGFAFFEPIIEEVAEWQRSGTTNLCTYKNKLWEDLQKVRRRAGKL